MLLEVLFKVNLFFTMLYFFTYMILLIERKNNVEKAKKIDEHVANLDYKEKEDNDVFLGLEDNFNAIILSIIFPLVPILNIFMIYINVHNLFFIWGEKSKKKKEKKNK